ncbi:type IVB secretion system protein IcmH/DotU [Veronia pacifica]|uniref:Type IV / VI secretion system DotU domain-containing protein n=1 Tax=Veronia pacifica TaxID=1080227 RepID=A0A1C3EDP7_9GAMM|nr:type IVB secretion system protein IcmH/DotU [Veronia pacifica]ODA31372.1 hypothetical protein A8L45_17440 [Veronia pacifica]
MTKLFTDQPTVQIRRIAENSTQTQSVEKTHITELSGTEKLSDQLSIYRSPLRNEATELLSLLVTLPRQGEPQDADRFRQRLLDSIACFRQRCLGLDYHPSVIEKSCFIFCAAFDEAILHTQWGQKVRWENQSLLSKAFSQRNGGEAFFVLLEKARQQPAKLVDFIELQYVLLMLGFQGKYRHGDHVGLHELKSDVYATLCRYREKGDMPVPVTPALVQQKPPRRFLRLKTLIALATGFLLAGYCVSEFWYLTLSQPVVNQFNAVDITRAYSSSVGGSEINNKAKGDKPSPANQQGKWELVLATFTDSPDARQFESEIRAAGYQPDSRDVTDGTVVYIEKDDSLQGVRRLKDELNVRFGLSATIKRAQN